MASNGSLIWLLKKKSYCYNEISYLTLFCFCGFMFSCYKKYFSVGEEITSRITLTSYGEIFGLVVLIVFVLSRQRYSLLFFRNIRKNNAFYVSYVFLCWFHFRSSLLLFLYLCVVVSFLSTELGVVCERSLCVFYFFRINPHHSIQVYSIICLLFIINTLLIWSYGVFFVFIKKRKSYFSS